MRFHVPKRVAYLVITGLVLIAIAGAAGSIGNAMRDNYSGECNPYGPAIEHPREQDGGNETEYEPPSAQEREECRAKRLPVTMMQAIMAAALAPGIAIVAISAAFIVAAAIAARQR